MDSNYTLFGSNKLEESSSRNDDSDMVESMTTPSLGHVQSSRLWQMQVWNRSVPYTRTQAEAFVHPFQLFLRCFIKSHVSAPEILESLDRSA